MQKTANAVLIDKYAQKTALRSGVAPDAVRAEFKKLLREQVTGKPGGYERPYRNRAEASCLQGDLAA